MNHHHKMSVELPGEFSRQLCWRSRHLAVIRRISSTTRIALAFRHKCRSQNRGSAFARTLVWLDHLPSRQAEVPANKIPQSFDRAYGCLPTDHGMPPRASEDRCGFSALPGGDSRLIILVVVADRNQQVGVPTKVQVVAAGRKPIDGDHALI